MEKVKKRDGARAYKYAKFLVLEGSETYLKWYHYRIRHRTFWNLSPMGPPHLLSDAFNSISCALMSRQEAQICLDALDNDSDCYRIGLIND